MKCRSLAFVAMTMLATHVANAMVLFDNVTGIPSDGFSGPLDGGPTYTMGASFTAATPSFSSIGLFLAAGSSSTTGSTNIYLVPDDGSGLGNGVAGLPTIEDASGNFLGLSGTQLIGTVSDSSLTSSFSTVSFWVDPAVTTQDHEYLVMAVSNAASSFEWSYAADGSGVGITGQSYSNDNGGTNLLPDSDSDPVNGGGYQMVVATPEPATIAVLSGGIAGLALLRRRAASKA